MSNYIFKHRNLIKKAIENSSIFVVLLFAAILFLSANTSVQAATFTVKKTADTNDNVCDSDCSLREAISAANAAATDDNIEFDATVFGQMSSITLSGTELTIANNGSLTINGVGANLLTISGNNQSRVFFINGGANVVINSLTITNGNAGIGDGGGILVDGSQITELSINNSRIINNAAGSATTGGSGGGIHKTGFGSLSINNSIISNNFAGSFGGGIQSGSGTLTIVNSTVDGNSARAGGGGISSNGSGNLSMTNSSITNNTATFQSGGGIANSGTATISNSTISGNSAGDDGGGIYNSNTGKINVTSSTISNNRAGASGGGDGGGVRNSNFTSNSFTLRNTIVADNSRSNGIPNDFRGDIISQGYNLIETTNNQSIFGDSTGNIIGQDPQLLPLGNYGGTTQTVALKPTSPAVDAADPNNFPEKDQRGISRPQDGNADGSSLPDIGAFELRAIAVTNTNDSGEGSLRQAILDANTNVGTDTIVINISPGGVQTIGLLTNLPRISDSVIIDATTQPGYAGNPIIELKRIGGGSSYGLVIDAGNTTIRGFVINNFHSGGIAFFNKGGNRIENNFIGTNIAGTEAQPNLGEGILIFNSSNNVIGGTAASKRNLISGNNSSGIRVNGNSSNNVFQANYIGTNITGTAVIPNRSEGICLCASASDFRVTNNLIGGTTPGTGNLLSGNRGDEIEISGVQATENIVQGNLIGTNAEGTKALTSVGHGIQISSNAGKNIIGGTAPGARNVISSNFSGSSPGGSGIELSNGAIGNVVKGNFIGTDITGTVALPNGYYGISIFNGSHSNIIGGVSKGEGNIIAFNGLRGITIANHTANATNNNSIRGNSIFFNSELGIDLTGDNTGVGVTSNDSCDADTGVNNLQNYPVLASANSNGANTNIIGSLNSTANAIFAIDFYASPSYDSTNFGEGKIYIGSANVTTVGNCNADFNVTLPYPATGGQFITATATDSNGNTSEFSQFVVATGTGTKAKFDFDGDGKSDVSVFRPSTGSWYLLQSSNNSFFGLGFGVNGDVITPADYDGDGKTDFTVFRPSNGTWYLQQSTSGFTAVQFGQNGDIPVPADYDGDGKADIAVYRPSTGGWFRLNSSNGQFVAVGFGVAEDKPTIGDYDGDGKADIAVFRPSTGSWYRLNSSNDQFVAVQFGVAEDKPVAADFDGDGKTDIAVFRPSTGGWYRLNSSNGEFVAVGFGTAEDRPVPADYDGDGKADVAVFRPSDGNWYVLRSTAGFAAVQFGIGEDKPVPNAFIR